MMTISKAHFNLLILSNLLCWTVLLLLFLNSFSSVTVDELNVKRINVKNNDGTTVIAISNKERIANPVIDGVTYPVAGGREFMSGMIFFNEEGDEIGGLIFNSGRLENGQKYGVGHLSFDRYKDNQVLAVTYNENKSGVTSGIKVIDRPGTGVFKQERDLATEYFFDPNTSDERKQEIKKLRDELRANNGLGVERIFLGSNHEIPQLRLKDKNGTVRIKLYVDEQNLPKLEFYDENGNLQMAFPEKG